MTRPNRPAKVREKVDPVLPLLPPIVELDETEEDLRDLLPDAKPRETEADLRDLLPDEKVSLDMLAEKVSLDMLPDTVSADMLAPGTTDLLAAGTTDLLLPSSNGQWAVGATRGMGRIVTHRVTRRTIIVLPPERPPAPRSWWLPAYEYEGYFKYGWTDKVFALGHEVDFEDAMRSLKRATAGKIRMSEDLRGSRDPLGVYALALREIAQTYAGYEDRDTARRSEWNQITAAYLLIRNRFVQNPELVNRLELEHEHFAEIAKWAGLPEPRIKTLTLGDLEAAIRADSMQGLGAAAADYLAWCKPEKIGGVLGQALLQMMANVGQLAPAELVPESPLDNFLFRHGTHNNYVLKEKWQGHDRMLLRGTYVVSKVQYRSLAAECGPGGKFEGRRPPNGLPGWRQCDLVPLCRPVHVCGVDCYEGTVGCGCGNSEITTLSRDKPNPEGCCEPDCRANDTNWVDLGYGCAC